MQFRDPELARHSKAVASLASQTAKKMRLSRAEQKLVILVGLLHDVGKLGIPDRILHKKGTLTDEEREIVQEHADLGADLLKTSSELGEFEIAVRAGQ